jgi:HK97 family phage prohead protease
MIEYRDASLSTVSFPKRTIEMIVMPYEQETTVEHRGRFVREVVSRGAFDGIQHRPTRVQLNRDHDLLQACGRAISFRPSNQAGLVAEVRVSNTVLGTETLELANDGILGASAGFQLMDRADAEEWPEKDLRRLNKLHLHHIAMTPIPAYEGAQVLAVRSDPPDAAERLPAAPGGIVVATPNRDRARALILGDMYSQLCR